jgi:hypothetical protein
MHWISALGGIVLNALVAFAPITTTTGNLPIGLVGPGIALLFFAMLLQAEAKNK